MRSCFRRGLADATVRQLGKMTTENNTLSMKFIENWKGNCWSCRTWSVITGRFVSHRGERKWRSRRITRKSPKRSPPWMPFIYAVWDPSILYETTNLISPHITRYIDEQFVDSMWIKLLTKTMRHWSTKYLIPLAQPVIVITFLHTTTTHFLIQTHFNTSNGRSWTSRCRYIPLNNHTNISDTAAAAPDQTVHVEQSTYLFYSHWLF